ncbi:MAG: SDR family oxidoreductase [Planctomycetota bacterium]|jgi:enoyl-[acyl-carrier protein] reductase I|nr:SDR family oxidoreductase [Planctomycetota bacterium]
MYDFSGKNFLVAGVANKKSVAAHIAAQLTASGANLILSVRSEARAETAAKMFPQAAVVVCDVENEAAVAALPAKIRARCPVLHGFAHSIAFANYAAGMKPFHETSRRDFLQAVDISCFSLIALANALKDLFADDASVAAISISSTRTAAPNYGYMAPIKAALDSSVVFLAKSFSAFSRVRFNSVNAGLLKTSASAGIPDYVNSYLFAEKLTLRRENLATAEVAQLATFLLSPLSSGINAQNIVIDAGMGVNSFDENIIRLAMR